MSPRACGKHGVEGCEHCGAVLGRRGGAMRCPSCGSPNTINVSYRRKPKWINGAAWRGHECRDCGIRFPSVQRVPTQEEIAEAGDVA